MMMENKMKKEVTGTGDIEVPRFGAAGMTEWVPVASSSDDRKKTVSRMDPRPDRQLGRKLQITETKTCKHNLQEIKLLIQEAASEPPGPVRREQWIGFLSDCHRWTVSVSRWLLNRPASQRVYLE